MNKNITLISSCLLLISAQAFADRPAMENRPAMEEPVAPIVTEAEAMDAMEETGVEPASAVEMSIQQEQYNTSQYVTGDALELQPGETLSINVLDFPRRGMSMDKVQNELGQPIQISDTVGEPPITSWIYSDRVVYFEHSNVIHVVAGN